uniref:Uncharacterized protein n=1 Tax=Rhizophora mucronata TaxID=61149 RepID=A0A2P2KGD7_RHIMU
MGLKNGTPKSFECVTVFLKMFVIASCWIHTQRW